MKKLKSFIGLIATGLLSLSFSLNAQTILIDSTFTSDTEIFPFTPETNIYGLGVSGEVTLNSDTSLVRLILIDSSFNEYLLYESYRMIFASSNKAGEDYNPTYAAGNTFSKEIVGFIGYNYNNEDPDPIDQNKKYCEPIVYTYHGNPSKYKVKPEPVYPVSSHLKLFPDGNVKY